MTTEKIAPTHEQMMAGYEVAKRFGVYERQAFELAEQMWEAMRDRGDLVAGEALRRPGIVCGRCGCQDLMVEGAGVSANASAQREESDDQCGNKRA